MSDTHVCRHCGAPLPATAGWCSLCHRRSFRAVRDELTEELRSTFDPRVTYRWRADERFTAPSPPPRFSRWQGGPVTFGPGVKLLVTFVLAAIVGPAAVLLGVILFRFSAGTVGERAWVYPFLSVMSLLVILAGGLLLAFIWRRARVE